MSVGHWIRISPSSYPHRLHTVSTYRGSFGQLENPLGLERGVCHVLIPGIGCSGLVVTMREYKVWVVRDSDGYRGMYQWSSIEGDVFPGDDAARPSQSYEPAVDDVVSRVKTAMLADPERP